MSSKQFTAKIFRWLHQVNGDLGLPLSAAKVAICLSSHFNEKEGGVAWPSCSTIGAIIGKCEATVINVVRALHARGHLRIEWGKQGRGCSNRYWIVEKNLDQGELFEDRKPQPVEVFDTPKTSILEAEKPQSAEQKPQFSKRKPQPVEEIHSKNHRRTIEGEKDSPRVVASREEKKDSRRRESRSAKARAVPAENFERFLAVYPKRVGIDAARKAFERVIKGGADLEALVARAALYAVERKGELPRFTMKPANWLKDGHWKDPPPEGLLIDGVTGEAIAVERPPPRHHNRPMTTAELIAQRKLACRRMGGSMTKSIDVVRPSPQPRGLSIYRPALAKVMPVFRFATQLRAHSREFNVSLAHSKDMVRSANEARNKFLPSFMKAREAEAILCLASNQALDQETSINMVGAMLRALDVKVDEDAIMGMLDMLEGGEELAEVLLLDDETEENLAALGIVWREPLKVSPTGLAMACRALIANTKYRPKPVELREACHRAQDRLRYAEQAAEGLVDLVRRCDAILLEFDHAEWERPYLVPEHRPLLEAMLELHDCYGDGSDAWHKHNRDEDGNLLHPFARLVEAEQDKLALPAPAPVKRLAAAGKRSEAKRSSRIK